MKNKRHTPEQVIKKLAEGDKLLNGGADIATVVKQLEITESTWHRWKAQYGGMKACQRQAPEGTRSGERTPEADCR